MMGFSVGEDNTARIELTDHVMGGLKRAKQIDFRKHFALEAAKYGYIRLNNCPLLNISPTFS
jgi:hypothetical protein